MATKKRIDIILGARDTSRAVFRGYEARLGGLKRTAASVAAVAGVGIGFAGLTRGLTGAVTAGADFEQKIANVRAVMRSTNEEMAPLIALTKELGATTAFSAGQAAEAAEQYALAGFSQQEIIKALPGTLALAAAGTLGMSEAATIGAQTLKQMGLEAGKLPEVVDVLALAASTANTDVSMLGEALGKTGVIGAGAGEDIQEITAALQLLADKGRQGADAGTAMRNIYLRLQTGTEGVAQALKELGVSVGDQSGRMKPLATIVGELNTALANYTPMQQAAFRATIAGTRAAADFDVILGAGEAGLRRYTQRLREAGGAADIMAKDKLNSLQGDLKLVASASEAAAISMTEFLDGGLRPAAQGLATLLSGTAEFIDQQGDLIVVAFAGAVALGGLKIAHLALAGAMRQVIGVSVATALWRIATAAPAVRGTMIRLTGAMVAQAAAAAWLRVKTLALKATLVGGLVLGLGLVVTAFIKARRESTSFGEALRRFGEAMRDIGKQAGFFRNMGEEASDAAKKVADASAKVVKAEADMAAAAGKSATERIAAAQALVEAREGKLGDQRDARGKVESEVGRALKTARDQLSIAEEASRGSIATGPFGAARTEINVNDDRVVAARQEVERLEQALESAKNQTRLTLGKEIAELTRAKNELARAQASDTSTPLTERLSQAQRQAAIVAQRLKLVKQTRPLDLDVADAEARLQALAAQAKEPLTPAELRVATDAAEKDLAALHGRIDDQVPAELKLEIEEARERLTELRRQVNTTTDPQQLAVDTREAQANLARLRAEAGVSLELEAQTADAEAKVQQLRIRADLPLDPHELKLETRAWETRLAALRQQVDQPLPRQKLELQLTAANRAVAELQRQIGEEMGKAARAAAGESGQAADGLFSRLRGLADRTKESIAAARETRDREFELTAQPIQVELRDLQRDVDAIVQGIRKELSDGLIKQLEAERRIEQAKEAGRRRGLDAVRGELDALNDTEAAPPRAGVEGIEISRRFLGLADSFRQQGERDAAARAARAAEDAAATAEKQRVLLERLLKAVMTPGRGGPSVLTGPLGNI